MAKALPNLTASTENSKPITNSISYFVRLTECSGIDKPESSVSKQIMLLTPDKRTIASRSLVYLSVVAILGLSFQQLGGLATSAGIFPVGKMTAQAPLTQYKDRVGIISVASYRDETLTLHPSFLRIDDKQNFVVWPVVSGDLARSPPYIALFQSLS